MIFHDHSRIKGSHAFLAPSSPYWLNYSEEKLIERWRNAKAAERGTILHDWAAQTISLGQKLPRSQRTINMYVNDALGYRMTPEVPLYFSDNCFGTTDAIAFNKNTLRISDLKTGISPVHMEQLEIYAALFCLEYHIKPIDIHTELRIYQNDEILLHEPDGYDIEAIIDRIKDSDKILKQMQEEGE